MTPEQLSAVMSCTPTYAKWAQQSRRLLSNRIRVEHARGVKAFIRSAPIAQTRTGVRELQRGVDVVNGGTRVGTRLFYLKPDNTVEHVDEWN